MCGVAEDGPARAFPQCDDRPFMEDAVAYQPYSQPAAEEVLELWKRFKADQSDETLRNRLIEIYLPLVRYNGERIWSRRGWNSTTSPQPVPSA